MDWYWIFLLLILLFIAYLLERISKRLEKWHTDWYMQLWNENQLRLRRNPGDFEIPTEEEFERIKKHLHISL